MEMNKNSQLKLARQFIIQNDPEILIPILKKRLPRSANVYNVAIIKNKWSDVTTWYTLDGDMSVNAWILAVIKRDDFYQEICVSRPLQVEITHEIKAAFSLGDFINWAEPYNFVALDLPLSTILRDISIRDKENCTTIYPSNLFYIPIQDALAIPDRLNLDPGTEIKNLNDEMGRAFISDTWHFASEGSMPYLEKCMNRNPSVGMYINGVPVSGVGVTCHGLMGMLYTSANHRGRGYAKLCVQKIIKEMTNQGMIPSCDVDLRNETSRHFQEKIGFKIVDQVEFVMHHPNIF